MPLLAKMPFRLYATGLSPDIPQYKFKRLVLRLELDNLLNQRHYAYIIFNGINTYTYDYGLYGRTAMLRATFKL